MYDAALQIETRIFSRIGSHVRNRYKTAGQLGVNFFTKCVRVGNLHSSDGIRIDCCHEMIEVLVLVCVCVLMHAFVAISLFNFLQNIKK
jgi:hypothetical protein